MKIVERYIFRRRRKNKYSGIPLNMINPSKPESRDTTSLLPDGASSRTYALLDGDARDHQWSCQQNPGVFGFSSWNWRWFRRLGFSAGWAFPGYSRRHGSGRRLA